MPSLLRLHRISHRYEEQNSQDTVKQIDLSVEAGQICTIIGESGSGKTTLLRLIGGKLDATEGTIWLAEQRVMGPAYNLVPGHPDIRTVFQDFSLSPNLNVYQNIAHVLQAYRRDYREERTRELINRLRLIGKEEQLPTTLSGGEKQRVALARALAEEPVLLLMDEPFSQVDSPLKRELMREVTSILHQTAGTALLVTHDAHDALSLADQIIVLESGRVVQRGTPQQVYERPVSSYVARLTGTCSVVERVTFQQWYPDFEDHNAKYVGIRPEHVTLSSDIGELTGLVIWSRYQGANYEVGISLDEKTTLIAYSIQPLVKGDSVSMAISLDNIILFAQ